MPPTHELAWDLVVRLRVNVLRAETGSYTQYVKALDLFLAVTHEVSSEARAAADGNALKQAKRLNDRDLQATAHATRPAP